MNLLQLLTGSLASGDSVQSVSKKTGVSSKLTSALLVAAIPVLISYLTKNASSQNGAQSLLGALGQHTSTNRAASQIAGADMEDGAKIISHILGSDQSQVVQSLASQSGMSADQVNSTLSAVAPALMSGLSSASATAATQASNGVNLADGLDLSDVMGMFSGSAAAPAASSSGLGGLGGLLGGLFGGSKPQAPVQQAPVSTADLGSVMSLLGGTSNAQVSQSSIDGSDLLGMLSAFMK